MLEIFVSNVQPEDALGGKKYSLNACIILEGEAVEGF